MSQAVLEVENLVKRYNGFTAVDGLSFEVYQGEIFGLLGPNGAGKTTTIRTVMGIFGPDEGRVGVLGSSPGEARERVGYLPEERGLYPRLRVSETLVYFAQLKGLSRTIARERALTWLERVGLADWARHRVRDLSQGMQQKVQFVASVIHGPRLLILDEPFQGLDPVNLDLMRALIRQLRDEGINVVLSSHQMNQVEALCDRIVLINQGTAVLYGSLDEIIHRHAPRTVRLRTADGFRLGPGDLPGVTHVEQSDHPGTLYTLTLGDIGPQELLRKLVERDTPIESFEISRAPLEEIFVAAVRGHP